MNKVCVITSVHQINDTRIYGKEVKSLAKRYETVYIARNNIGLPDEENLKIVDIKRPRNRIKRMFLSLSVFNTARAQKAEIYHFQDPELILCGILLKIFTKGKVIYDVHEDYPDYILQKEYINKHLRPIISGCMKFAEWIGNKVFDGIVVADDGVYKRFSPHKTEIIYNFPDISKFNDETFSKEYDLIYPGTISFVMLQNFIEIARALKNKGVSAKMLLVTRFDYERMKERVSKEGVSDIIEVMDKVPYDKVVELIKRTKIGLIPLPDTLKFSKNIPTKLFEYMLCEIPSVISDLAPSRKFAKEGNFAFLVKADDYDAYADKINILLCDEKMASDMGKEGKRLVLEKFNWQKEEEKLYAFYEKILEKGRRN